MAEGTGGAAEEAKAAHQGQCVERGGIAIEMQCVASLAPIQEANQVWFNVRCERSLRVSLLCVDPHHNSELPPRVCLQLLVRCILYP